MYSFFLGVSLAFSLLASPLTLKAEEERVGGSGKPSADVVLWNGNICTAVRSRSPVTVEALAIDGERIVFVGSKEEARDYLADHTQVVDLNGRTVLPGFTDAHVHPVAGGLIQFECSFREAINLDSISAVLAKYAAEHPEMEWIRGANLHLPAVAKHPSPRTVLDQVVSDRPVYIVTDGAHSAFVNTKALELAGITAESTDPAQGIIGREPKTGAPSGALFETAMKLVSELLPEYSREDRASSLKNSLAMLNSLGITNFVEARATEDHFLAYLDVAKDGDLTAHVSISIHAEISDGLDAVRDALEMKNGFEAIGPLPADIAVNQVKLFMDGTVEEQTAAMLENYKGKTHRGQPLADLETTKLVIAALDRMGVQIHVHAIGDRAVRMALDGFEHAQRTNGQRDSRHHIAHLNVVDRDDIARFGALGVTANLQALWATIDDPYVGKINRSLLEAEPFDWQYPIGSIHRSGGRLAFGSDWPVSTADPFSAIQVAVTRRGPDKEVREPWTPQHLIDVAAAIHGYTLNGAWLTFREAECGTLEVGKLADLVILGRDIWTAPKHKLMDTKVDQTFFRGRIVFDREKISGVD